MKNILEGSNSSLDEAQQRISDLEEKEAETTKENRNKTKIKKKNEDMSLGPLYVLLGEVPVQVFCQFFKIGFCISLEWSCVSCLYILEIKPLSKVSLANMFSQYSWFPFHFC